MKSTTKPKKPKGFVVALVILLIAIIAYIFVPLGSGKTITSYTNGFYYECWKPVRAKMARTTGTFGRINVSTYVPANPIEAALFCHSKGDVAIIF